MSVQQQQAPAFEGPSEVEANNYYFFKTTSKEEAARYAPKPLSKAEIEAEQKESQAKATGGPSAWNKGGTWEERDCSDWAIKRLEALLAGMDLSKAGATVTKAEVKGDASIIYSRGKARVGHEFKVTLTISGATEGKVVIPCMDDISDGDWEMEYSVTKGSKSELRKSTGDVLQVQYEQFMTEFRAL